MQKITQPQFFRLIYQLLFIFVTLCAKAKKSAKKHHGVAMNQSLTLIQLSICAIFSSESKNDLIVRGDG
jgi:hypothetical protein